MQGSTRAERIAALAYDYAAQPKQSAAMCDLCGAHGRDVTAVAHRDRYGFPASLAVCRRCGLGWLSPRMTPEAYARFYDGVYRPLVSAYHGRCIDAETVQVEQRAYATELAGFLEPPTSRIVRGGEDSSGSTGVVAAVLAGRLDARATVLDPAPDELEVARAAGVETIAGLVEDLDRGERCWDLVLLCQTIDHLLEVRRTLSALRRMTSAAGRAFIDILDVDLMLQRAGAIERAIKIDHPYYLTRDTAVAFFALSGYVVLAERESGDGHRGFVLAPGVSVEPDWRALGRAATEFLRRAGYRQLSMR